MSDLSLNPDYVYTEVIEYKTIISEFENGYEQRRSKWSAPLRRFSLIYKNRSNTDLSTLVTLFNTKYGAYDYFTWTNPNDSTEYTVRFKEDSLEIEKVFYNINNIKFDLLQVRV